MEQEHHGSGDNVGGDKIDRQVNIKTGNYIEKQIVKIGDKKKPRHLTAPPFFPEIFIGTDADINRVYEKLFEEFNFLLLINGEGGIGKTSLASRYYHKYENKYRHLAWVFTEKSIVDALLILALPLGIEFEDQMTSEERINELLRYMAALKKPCLLVLDNANELQDLEKNYYLLRKCSNFHILLTTRITEFQQASYHKIGPLKGEDPIKLFRIHYPKHRNEDDDILREILFAVGYNTLIIELLGKTIHKINRLQEKYSLYDLLADLQERGLFALTKSSDIDTNYHTFHKAKPEEIIEAMYDISGLDMEESKLLSFFTVLPAERIDYTNIKNILPDVIDLDVPLLTLAQKGWLDYNEKENSFKISPVIQEVFLKKYPNILSDCESLISTLIDKLEYENRHIIGCSYEAASQYARYAESIINRIGEVNHSLSTLSDRLGSYYDITGKLDLALRYFEKYHQMTKELYKKDPTNVQYKYNLGISYIKLGQTHVWLGDLVTALGYFEKRKQLSEELFSSDVTNVRFKSSLAISYEKLGETYSSLGILDKALSYYLNEKKLFEEMHASNPANEGLKHSVAISSCKLGETHTLLDNIDQALDFYKNFNTLVKELYDSNRTNADYKNSLAVSNCKLGEIHTLLGNLEMALTFYGDYNLFEKELFEAYPTNVDFKNNLAISYSKLGETGIALGNLRMALNSYEEHNQLCKELYETYPTKVSFKNGLAISYSKLGETHTALGNLDKALTFFEKDLQLSKELYEANQNNVSLKNGLAISYLKLGEFYRDINKNTAMALFYFKACEKLLEELVSQFPLHKEFSENLAEVRDNLSHL